MTTKALFAISRRVLLGLLILQAPLAVADEPKEPSTPSDSQLASPFVGENTFLLAKIRPSKIALPESFETKFAKSPEAKQALKAALTQLTRSLNRFNSANSGESVYVVASFTRAGSDVQVAAFQRHTSEVKLESLKPLYRELTGGTTQVLDGYVVASRSDIAKSPSPAPKELMATFDAALHATAECPIQIVAVPPEHMRRTVRELSPELPPELGGGPSSVLTEGVQWMSVGIDPEKLRIKMVIQSADESAAKALAAYVPKLLTAGRRVLMNEFSDIPERVLVTFLAAIKAEIHDTQVLIELDGTAETGAAVELAMVVEQWFESSFQRNTNVNRLRQILLGMHNYHDVNRMLPPGDKHRDEDGKPNLSWRVHILPYMEQAELYSQFKLDEPWDSDHNKKLIEKMPDIYAPSPFEPTHDQLGPGRTTFVAPVGEGTMFGREKTTRFQHIVDGLSNTIAVLEVTPENSVPWTAPQDYKFNPEKPLAGVQFDPKGTWLAAFADGSVHHLPRGLAKEMCLRIFQMNDGEVVDLDP